MLLTECISRFRRNSKLTYTHAIAQLAETETDYVTSSTPATLAQLKLQTRAVDQMCQERARYKMFFRKPKAFEHRERPGKLLAYLAHLDSRPTVLITLKSAMVGNITDPALIVKEFERFFKEVYTSEVNYPIQDLKNLFDALTLPKLNAEQVEMLEVPLSADDIKLAISQFANAKAPMDCQLNFMLVFQKPLSLDFSPYTKQYLRLTLSMNTCMNHIGLFHSYKKTSKYWPKS